LGDGSTNQGDFHEGLNFAGVHQLPVITLVQNNNIAISVPFDKQIASENIAVRASSYGMPGFEVDGNNPLEVYDVMKEAHKRAKNGEGPTWIEAVSERLTAHASDDNQNKYRTEEELNESKEKESNISIKKYLYEHELSKEEIEKEIESNVAKEVNDATKYAEEAPYPDIDTIKNYVYELQGGSFMVEINYLQAITKAMDDELARDENVFIFGEDVGAKGGVFRATDNLYDKYGEKRVIDAPLAESGIVGVAIGAAMYGLRPIAEIQFVDFILPAVNQIISEAAKIRYRSNNDWNCPITI